MRHVLADGLSGWKRNCSQQHLLSLLSEFGSDESADQAFANTCCAFNHHYPVPSCLLNHIFLELIDQQPFALKFVLLIHRQLIDSSFDEVQYLTVVIPRHVSLQLIRECEPEVDIWTMPQYV